MKEGLNVSQQPLIILSRVEELERYTRIALRQFPKYEKFILSAEIRHQIYEIKRNTIRVGKKYTKKTTLTELDIDVEVLRSQIRVAYRLQYIDEHKLDVWMRKVDEIGAIVGGWLKKLTEDKR